MDSISYLKDHFLIALEAEKDSLFYRSVVYVCEHNETGAIGLVVNSPTGLQLDDILESLEITVANPTLVNVPVFTGGPVKEEVGVVLHDGARHWNSSIATSSTLTLTTSRDILLSIAAAQGPKKVFFSLGHSGWSPGQLEEEIARDYWLVTPAQENIIFEVPIGKRWEAAIRSLGIEPNQLVTKHGNA